MMARKKVYGEVGKEILDGLSKQMNVAQRNQFNAVRLALGGDVKHATELMQSVYDVNDITGQILTALAHGDVDKAQALWIDYIGNAKKQLQGMNQK